MSIRFATIEDIPQLQYIRSAVKENILNNPLLVTYNDYVSLITDSGKGWVHENGNSITGFAIVDTQKNNLWALFIDPAYERKGIGRMLHDEMVSWYFDNHQQPLWLTTAKGTRAEEFYRLSGWKQTGINATNEIIFEITPQIWLERNRFSPKINSERLQLRPLREEDVHDLFFIRTHPDVNRFLHRNIPSKIEDVELFIQKIKELQKDRKGIYWIIGDKLTHQFFGTICLFDIDIEHKQADIGYELLPQFWGKGIMSEAIDAVLNYVQNNLGLTILKGYSAIGNDHSNQLLQKKGFKKADSDVEGHDLYVFSAF
jgi:RimJ/RimL family protein N-acetyltransferase